MQVNKLTKSPPWVQMLKSCSRNVFFSGVLLSRSVNPNSSLHGFPLPLISRSCHRILSSSVGRNTAVVRLASIRSCSSSGSISSPTMSPEGEIQPELPTSPATQNLEKQFEDFRRHLEDSGNFRERIRAVASEIESVNRLMHGSLLLVHQSGPASEVLEKAKSKIIMLKELFGKLAEILHECSGQCYRYHGDWRSEAQSSVSLLGFTHWLETGTLLLHTEAEEKLGFGLHSSEFGLDIEDYLIGICFMSNELPRYVVNRVTAGDYDCPRNVLNFLTDLHTSFRMLNLRNDFLRKKFDGMKYDLRKVEDVYYDVKIRGLGTINETKENL